MGPTPREENRGNENYEEDGWYIGYEVQMEGLGVVNVYAEANSDSDSDGYIGPENDDSDDENAEVRRAGYTNIPSNMAGDSDSEEDCNVRVDDTNRIENLPGPSQQPFNSNISPPIQKAFQNALDSAESVHLSDKDFQFKATENDIQMSQDKINEIKSSMANFEIQKPEWVDAAVDEKILNFFTKLNKADN
ncbi:hypothetical protein M3Y97_00055200 [Aphelenchoides bicaudatus]|nr:hypothetical protein M3Y97_00055200 [Aphelenchoides bicaudatus]